MKHLCLNCEKGDMVRTKKDSEIEYRGHRAIVRALDGWHCPECGEVEFAGKEGVRYAEALEKLRLKIDAEESAELARIRKKLKLSQRRAAAIAGGGVNAFSRYENGKARPVAAVVNLFRLLEKHPELLDEIAA
ncbi:type II toxin-antitoxin system MqsA family antitoxin [Sideroxydans lithotrophicus]|uniref:Transcriptional regulator, XRE family n=1 Tax=Sideroxydans lithotrophicus (strain ES-1) TaxID=580332 RepID=D5CN75_SIDLE|nr:type II toxin-antitoxin system MqsA family antitoxin [Sideroxydans lithotrophicus]ADE12772.1 transcriptional regulator, XRE family [Sideroxydans lithotrophicus ES-1]